MRLSEDEKTWSLLKTSRDASSIKMPKEVQDIAKPILERLQVLREPKLEPYVEPEGEGNVILRSFHEARVPITPGTTEPDFLLFGLDDETKVYREQLESIKKSRGKNIFGRKLIFAHTGAGKTKFCTELLSVEYGFFFSFIGSEKVKPGSQDLELVMNDVASKIANKSFRERRCLAATALHCMFLARVLIFHTLYSRNEISTPLDWLLVQMYPIHFLGERQNMDVFAYLTTAMLSQFLDVGNLLVFERLSDPVITACKDLIKSPKCCWNVVFDEAQYLTGIMKNEFLTTDVSLRSGLLDETVPNTTPSLSMPSHSSSHDGFVTSGVDASPMQSVSSTGLRSSLSPVLVTSQGIFDRVISCGTGLSEEDIKKSALSGVDTDAVTDLQGFPRLLGPDDVKEFLKRVLGQSQTGCEDTLDFAASWLTGRPRFMIWFLKFLARCSSPLSRESVENFVVETCAPTEARNKAFVGFVAMSGLKRLPEVCRIEEIEVIRHALFEFVLYGKNTSIVEDMAVVEQGIATLGLKGELRDPQARQAKFVEPLMAESIRQCMATGQNYAVSRLVYASRNQSAAGFQFEEVVTLALANSDIFNANKSLLKLHPVETLTSSLTGVATSAAAPSNMDGFLKHVMNGRWKLPLSHFGQLLSKSGSDQHDLAWLRYWCGRATSSPNTSSSSSSSSSGSSSSSSKPAPKRSEVMGTPCLLPSSNMGPDIAFALSYAGVENDVTVANDSEILFVFIQCKFQDASANFTEAAQTVDPSQFYAIRKGNEQGNRPNYHTEVGKQMDELLKDVPVLRIVLCYPRGFSKLEKVQLKKRGPFNDVLLLWDKDVVEGRHLLPEHVTDLLQSIKNAE